MYALYMVTFIINIPPMLAYIAYMDPMGNVLYNTFYMRQQKVQIPSIPSGNLACFRCTSPEWTRRVFFSKSQRMPDRNSEEPIWTIFTSLGTV